MTFLEHFGILRKSFIKIIVFIAILFVPAFLFREILMEIALVPITESIPNDSKIIFTKPAEALSSNIRLALLTSFLCSFPLIIYEVWAFIGPGLYQKEKRISLMVIILGTALFFLGAFLCFKFVAPLTFNILLNEYSSESIIAFPNISDTLLVCLWWRRSVLPRGPYCLLSSSS